jgi:hypothetical protein
VNKQPARLIEDAGAAMPDLKEYEFQEYDIKLMDAEEYNNEINK